MRYMNMPADGDLEERGFAKLRETFGEGEGRFVIESIETSDHGGDEWSAVAQVYDQQTGQYVGVLRWHGVGEDLADMDDVIFEPQSSA